MRSNSIRRACGIVSLALLVAIVRSALGETQAARIGNGKIDIEVSGENGSLVRFHDVDANHNFIESDAAQSMWAIEAVDGTRIESSQARSFTSQMRDDGATLELTWHDFGRTDAPELTVTASIEIARDSTLSRWRIGVQHADMSIRSVTFPRLPSIAEQEGETLAVPIWMGEQTRRAREELAGGRRLEWEYPGRLSMQCMTLYRPNGPGLYLACADSEYQQKRFAVVGEGGRIGLEILHLVETDAPVDSMELPYDVIVGSFSGDWYTAANIYRTWAIEQPWVRTSRLKSGAVPEWVMETGIWVWNRGRSPGVLGPAAALREASGLPVSVLWHWWHGCSYDTGFPEYLPPREGDESFRSALSAAHETDVHAIVYMNQRLWGITTQSWIDRGAERFAVKGADGKVHPEVYNIFTKAPCAPMCMGTAFWRDTYADLAERAILGLGVDGIYMDQACSSLACYDPEHGHTIGGGSYWMKGFQQLERDIRRRTASRLVALAGEGCGEAWLPNLDLMLNLQVSKERYSGQRDWEPIPFFHAVYHDSAILFGNYSSLTMPPYDDLWPKEFAPAKPLALLDERFSKQFMLEQARAFVWGQQISVANFQPEHFETRRDEIDFVVRLAQLRRTALDYLQYGTMLRPPELNAGEMEIEMSRLSIYAGQQDQLKEFKQVVPRALGSVWRAPDGDVAVTVVNISDDPVEIRMPLDRENGWVSEYVGVRPLTGGETIALANGGERAKALRVPVPARGAQVYEFVRNGK